MGPRVLQSSLSLHCGSMQKLTSQGNLPEFLSEGSKMLFTMMDDCAEH